MRNLTKAVAALSLWIPISSFGLGIGDIKLHSALNQNLKAEIPLIVSEGEDISGVKVRLAPVDKFDEAGIPWSYFLSKIHFHVQGSTIKLSSKEPLKEPFLDLLLEVTWPNGNVYREFTVLLDPPDSYPQTQAAPVAKAAKSSKAKKVVAESKPTPVAEFESTPVLESAPAPAAEEVAKNEITEAKIEPEVATEESKPKLEAEVKPELTDSSSKSVVVPTLNESTPTNTEAESDKDGEIISTPPLPENDSQAPEKIAEAKPITPELPPLATPQSVSNPDIDKDGGAESAPSVTAVEPNPVNVDLVDKDGAIPQPPPVMPVVTPPPPTVVNKPTVVKNSHEYGPTSAKTKLEEIAAEVNKTHKISNKQMAYALYKLNPQAFANNDIHALKAGQLLKIPNQKDLQKIFPPVVVKKSKPPTIIARTHILPPKVSPKSEQEWVKGRQEQIKSKPVVTRLRITPPPHETKLAKNTEVTPSAMAAVTAQDQDRAKKLTNENQDLQIKLKKSNSQLEIYKQQFDFQSKQLAALTKQLAELRNAKGGEATKPVVAPSTTAAAPSSATGTAQLTPEEIKRQKLQAFYNRNKAASQAAASGSTTPAPATTPATPPVASATPPVTAEAAKPLTPEEIKRQKNEEFFARNKAAQEAKPKPEADRIKAEQETKAKEAEKVKQEQADKAAAAEKARIADEQAKTQAEAKRIADEIAKADKIKADKLATEKAKTEATAQAVKAEAEKLATEKAKIEAEKKAAEQKVKEVETKAAADKARLENERLKAVQQAEQAKLAAEKAKKEQEAKAKEEAARIAANHAADLEAERLKHERELKVQQEAAIVKQQQELKRQAEEATLKHEQELKAQQEAAALKYQQDLRTQNEEARKKDQAAALAHPVPPPAVTPPINVQVVTPPSPAVVEPTEEEESLVDTLLEPYNLAVAGLLTTLLAVWGWLLWRKKHAEKPTTEVESMLSESSEINLPDDEDEFSVAGIDEGNSSFMFGGESSFLSDDNDFDAFEVDQDEVDPISEADVYLAYGRYQQAEELIRQAIIDQPARNECKLKLLEIFCANENSKAFEDYVQQLAHEGKQSNVAFWTKVAEMGRTIIPDSPLLELTADTTETPQSMPVANVATPVSETKRPELSKVEEVDEEIEEFDENTEDDFDLTLFNDEPPVSSSPVEKKNLATDTAPFSLAKKQPPAVFSSSEEIKQSPAPTPANFSSPSALEKTVTQPAPLLNDDILEAAPQPESNEIEFDLSEFEIDTAQPEPEIVEPPANNIEFDLSEFEIETAESKPEIVEPPANNIEFDLSEFEIETVAESEAEMLEELPANNIEFDMADFAEDKSRSEPVVVEIADDNVDNAEFDLSEFEEEGDPEELLINGNVKSGLDLSIFDEILEDDLEDDSAVDQLNPEATATESKLVVEEFDLGEFDEFDFENKENNQSIENKSQALQDEDLLASMIDEDSVAIETLGLDNEIEIDQKQARNVAIVETELEDFTDDDNLFEETQPINKVNTSINEIDLADFDLNDFDTSSASEIAEASKEFDLNDFVDSAETPKDHQPPIEIDIDDFDLSDFEDTDQIDKTNNAVAEIDIDDFDLNDFEDIDTKAKMDLVKHNDHHTEKLDQSSLNAEINELSETKQNDFNETTLNADSHFFSDEEINLDNINVLATKIDLAKAYIDMGDIEAAKNMLEKVKREGNEQQQKIAADMLSRLI